jgi:flagellar hook-basal body complex protein FliE
VVNKVGSLNQINMQQKLNDNNKEQSGNFDSVFNSVKNSIDEVNTIQKDGEKALSDIATGQVKDLHQAAIAINKAATSMKFMLEVRNKAVNAYKEILKTQM